MLRYLTITEQIYDAMVAHARAEAPLEACGILSGRPSLATSIHEMTNADKSPEHFSLLPEEQFAVAKEIRARAEEMLAVYHSHPATPARPSEEDRRLAFAPGIIHIIVSLAMPDAPDVNAFLLDDASVTPVSLHVSRNAEQPQPHEVET